MITFSGDKKVISNDQLMVLKLSLEYPKIIRYYMEAFSDYESTTFNTQTGGKIYRRNHEFLGFLLDNYGIGVILDHQQFVAVHKMKQNWDWDKYTFEESIARPWVLMFQGCDNTSFYLRFETEEQLDVYWSKTFVFERTNDMIIYN